ncbi:MAG: DNA polymerase III subunit delta' [Chloroflexota bacterium]
MWQIIGQSRAVSLLQRSLEAGSLAHAYLFVGPPHVGKMTLARNLAQALNCLENEPPCGQCAACRRIDSASHSDVQVIGLAQNGSAAEAKLIGIDQVREIQHSASLPPFEGRCKVFIIEGAESLSNEAANCLLKTLEEPTGSVAFILLATNESLLPETVVSRCQKVELAPLPAAEVESALGRRGIEPAKARLLARLSHGCPGWAISAAGDEAALRKRDEALDSLLGLIGAGYEERFAHVARLAVQFRQNRGVVYDALDLWLYYWRDLLLIKAGCQGMITNIDRSATLAGMAGGYRLAQIKAVIDGIRAAGEQLRQNVNPQLALEVLMLDMPGKEGVGEGFSSTRQAIRNG